MQHHRAQSTRTGARRSLVSACDKADDIENVLCECGVAFDERFAALMKFRVSCWGRTTCFDVLLRAGALAVSGETYRPDKAYLRGSQGPSAGSKRLWGVPVTVSNADLCAELLRRWTQRWDAVASTVGVGWEGKPYDSADFENALCVFQEPHRAGLPNPGEFSADALLSGCAARRCRERAALVAHLGSVLLQRDVTTPASLGPQDGVEGVEDRGAELVERHRQQRSKLGVDDAPSLQDLLR
ncbi:MAG TPA: hypothetical protein VK988_16100 [Acidimicrobiales bacterium]|nr:hypothetical protein [Acidimicrobiales bacterium]